VKLEIGSVSESVEVSAATPLLETETATSGGIMEGETIVKIPIMQKLTFRVLPYLPDTQVINGLHLNGQRERAMGYNLDGLGAKEPVTGAVGSTNRVVTSSIDAVQEVKAYATGMPAEFGHTAGGALSVIFRSGTNQLHGSAEDRFLNNTTLHRDYFDIQKPPPESYHEITAVVSGPVRIPKLYNGKDKTFWLFGYETHHENASETFIGDVPTPDMLNGNFNFLDPSGKQVGNTIYDPATIRQLQNGTWTSDPFPGNIVPKNRFDPVAVNFLSHNPFTPSNTAAGFVDKLGPHQDLIAPTKYGSFRTRWDAKIDHAFSDRHKIFGRYSQAHHTSYRDRLVNEAAWRLIDPNAIPFPIDQPNIVISDTFTFTPTLINEFRVGFNRRQTTKSPDASNQNWAQQLGIPGVSGISFPFFVPSGSSPTTIIPAVSNTQTYYRTGPGGESSEVWEDLRAQENLTKVWGPHTIKGGYEILRTRYNVLNEALPSGKYFMSGTELPFSTAGTSGNDFADLLLGTVGQAQFSQALATWLPRWWSHSFYAQDDFRPIKNLTLNLGLRWSYESPFSTKYGQQSQFDPNAIDPISGLKGAIVHKPGELARKDLNNWQPRIGLAWSFRPNWVFRSSFSVIHSDLFTNDVSQNFEEYVATSNIQAPSGDPRTVFTLSQGPPKFNFTTNADGSAPYIGTNFGSRNATWYDPNMRTPYVMSWSGGFQWQFAKAWLVEAMYQGSAGVKLMNALNINVLPPSAFPSDPAQIEAIRQNFQNYKPYPQFGNINLVSNFGHNTYHSGTLRFEKRYSQGTTLNAFYTWSKTIDNYDDEGTVSNGLGNTASAISYFNRSLEKGRASYDVHHRWVTTVTEELPFGKGRKWMTGGGIKNLLLGGWEVVWIQTFQSGPPFTVTFAGSPFNYLPGVGNRPNQILSDGQVKLEHVDIGPNRFPFSAQNRYLNINGFAYPAPYTIGTLGRNTLEAPGIIWPQTSLQKTWTIRERFRVTMRADVNNIFKYHNFNPPNSAFNKTDPSAFGTFTGTRGSFSDIGTGRWHTILVGRVEW